MQVTTAVFSASVGLPTENMFSQVAKMILFRFGPLPNPLLLHAAKAINLGSQLCALTHGAAMIATIDLDP
jgi:hypothetical protein